MEKSTLKASERKKKRILRIRKKIVGTPDRPRLCMMKSNNYVGIQVIDDTNSLTLASLTSSSKDFKVKHPSLTKVEIAKIIGKRIAEVCLEKGIKSAVLDRRGNKYHGIIAAFADAAREQGLEF